jgi:hypothetical protein
MCVSARAQPQALRTERGLKTQNWNFNLRRSNLPFAQYAEDRGGWVGRFWQRHARAGLTPQCDTRRLDSAWQGRCCAGCPSGARPSLSVQLIQAAHAGCVVQNSPNLVSKLGRPMLG